MEANLSNMQHWQDVLESSSEYAKLLALARSRGCGRADAEDAVQQAILNCIQSKTVPDSPIAFWKKVTKNLSIDMRRKRRRRDRVEKVWAGHRAIRQIDSDRESADSSTVGLLEFCSTTRSKLRQFAESAHVKSKHTQTAIHMCADTLRLMEQLLERVQGVEGVVRLDSLYSELEKLDVSRNRQGIRDLMPFYMAVLLARLETLSPIQAANIVVEMTSPAWPSDSRPSIGNNHLTTVVAVLGPIVLPDGLYAEFMEEIAGRCRTRAFMQWHSTISGERSDFRGAWNQYFSRCVEPCQMPTIWIDEQRAKFGRELDRFCSQSPKPNDDPSNDGMGKDLQS